MSVLRPRNRLVYFRVSEDEYERFNHVCESTGSRSISDLARFAMRSMIENGNQQQDRVSEKLSLLEAMVHDLSCKVHQISLSLASPAGRSAVAAEGSQESGGEESS